MGEASSGDSELVEAWATVFGNEFERSRLDAVEVGIEVSVMIGAERKAVARVVTSAFALRAQVSSSISRSLPDGDDASNRRRRVRARSRWRRSTRTRTPVRST
jgi:hypothetical protein